MSATLLAPSARTAPLPSAPVECGRERQARWALWRVTAWRLTVVLSALVGVWLAALQYDVWWTALSQLASLAVAASYVALAATPFVTQDRRHEPRSPWLRGALATLMVLVSLAYLVMTGGDLSAPYSVFEHLITPALVVVDFLLVGGNQARVRWWHPLSWLLPPAAYLVYYVVGDLQVYVALDVSRPETFAVRSGLLGALVLGTGLALYAVGRSRRR